MKRLLRGLAVAGVIGVVVLAIVGLAKLRGSAKPATAAGTDTAIPVSTAQARVADVPLTVDGIGTVQALNTVNIRPNVDGPLTEIRFREGQDVHAGDVLARIDARTYQAAYDQAVAKKAQDEATLANVERDLARYDKLAKTQYTTAQQADTQRSLVAQDQAIIRQDQAQIDSAQTNLSYTTIRAPVDGRTGIRQVDVGNLVHSTDATPLTVVTTLRPISVVFTLPQQILPQVVAAIESARPPPRALPPPPRPSGAGPRPGCGAGQRGGPEHRHHQAEGDLPQPGAAPVAGSVRERPAFAAGGPRSDHGAHRRGAARSAGRIRVHLGPRHRLTPPGDGGAPGRAGGGDLVAQVLSPELRVLPHEGAEQPDHGQAVQRLVPPRP